MPKASLSTYKPLRQLKKSYKCLITSIQIRIRRYTQLISYAVYTWADLRYLINITLTLLIIL